MRSLGWDWIYIQDIAVRAVGPWDMSLGHAKGVKNRNKKLGTNGVAELYMGIGAYILFGLQV
jgi:hypothetical protein